MIYIWLDIDNLFVEYVIKRKLKNLISHCSIKFYSLQKFLHGVILQFVK